MINRRGRNQDFAQFILNLWGISSFDIFSIIAMEIHNSAIENPSQSYKPVNCCSSGASISQVLAIGLFLAIQILSFNLLPHMLRTQSPAMHVIMAFSYVSLLCLIIEYARLLASDPSDPRLKDASFQAASVIEEKNCEECKAKVASTSYHCHSCNRCAEQFDHHCTFANNCVGKENYSIFIRLLLSVIVHTSSNMGIGVWLALARQDAFRWIAVAFAALSLIVFLEITVLAVFHCYISFYLHKTTLEVLKGDASANQESEQTNINFVKANGARAQAEG